MNISRRNFLKGAAALATAPLWPETWPAIPAAAAHRIVRARHPLASYFDLINFEFQAQAPETYYGNFVSQEIVNRLFDAALCALTGDADPTPAMRQLVPYRTGERVFIKINTTTCFKLWPGQWEKVDWEMHYNDTDALAEPINAVVRALVRIGVPQEMIGIADPTWTEGPASDPERRTPRPMPNRIAKKIKAAFPSVALYRSSFTPGSDGITWKSNDPHAVVRFRSPVLEARKARATSHRLPDQLIEAAHFISVPIMKTHNQGGVTGALKNNFGTVASCRGFHDRFPEDKITVNPLLSDAENPAVDLWLNPHLGAKTRLIVCDGIVGGWDWGEDPPLGWRSFGGRSPNCLLLGTDPVAMDSIIYNQVTAALPEKVSKFSQPNMLRDAARMGLGRCELKSGGSATYQSIDYVEINQAANPDRLRKLDELKKRYLAGGKTRSEIRDLQSEFGGDST